MHGTILNGHDNEDHTKQRAMRTCNDNSSYLHTNKAVSAQHIAQYWEKSATREDRKSGHSKHIASKI